MVTFSTVHRSKFEKEVEKKVSQPLSQLWTPFSKPRGEKQREGYDPLTLFFSKKKHRADNLQEFKNNRKRRRKNSKLSFFLFLMDSFLVSSSIRLPKCQNKLLSLRIAKKSIPNINSIYRRIQQFKYFLCFYIVQFSIHWHSLKIIIKQRINFFVPTEKGL